MRIDLNAKILLADSPDELYNPPMGKKANRTYPKSWFAAYISLTLELLAFAALAAATPNQAEPARGRVVDSNGHPVTGAVIRGLHLFDPEGALYIISRNAEVRTDINGHFHLPPPTRWATMDDPVHLYAKRRAAPAPTWTYDISVDHPGFFPSRAQMDMGKAAEIRMQKGTQFHRFTFEEPASSKTNRTIYFLGDEPIRTMVRLPERYQTEGGWLRPGTYQATAARYEIQPIQVDSQSPKERSFRVWKERRLSGRVFDGQSGKPAAGALVFAYDSAPSRKIAFSFAALPEAGLLDLLNTWNDVDPMKHPYTVRLRALRQVRAVTRTDDQGRYEFPTGGERLHAVVCLAPGMLPTAMRAESHRWDAIEVEQTLAPIYLFPAARVRLTTRHFELPDRSQSVHCKPRWTIVESENPPWLKRFNHAAATRQYLEGFRPTHDWSRVGERREYLVPANLDFHFHIIPYSSYSPVLFDGPIRLAPGQTLDLGARVVSPAASVTVRVLTPKGTPVEGVHVLAYRDILRDTRRATDASGETQFSVPTSQPGRLQVVSRNLPEHLAKAANLQICYRIDGSTEKTFEVRLTAEQMKFLP